MLASSFVLISCGREVDNSAPNPTARPETRTDLRAIRTAMTKVEPFFKPMGKPKGFDWLASHREPGQTFDEYLDSNPTKPTKERQTIYVLPLGKFTEEQKKVIEVTAGYLAVFYDLPVKQMPPQAIKHPLSPTDSRKVRYTAVEQIRTGYLMESVLKPQLPKDAAALIAFTSSDLFPDETMNFVFGQASMEDRVGVWSLYRLDDNADEATFLRRTLKIAAHETGHMFSIRHCTKYECVMSGTNYLEETDRRPIDACPECMAKVCWLSGISPTDRYRKLAEFCKKNGLTKEADEFEKKVQAVSP